MHIQCRHRFVQEEQLRLRRQRAGQRHPLSLPTGELGGLAVPQLPEPEPMQPLVGDPCRLAPGGTPAARSERDVLCRAEVGEEPRLLSEHRDPASVRGEPLPGSGGAEQRPVAQLSVTAGRSQEPGQHLQHCGLARTVGAQDRQVLAVGDLERHLDIAGGQLEVQTQAHRLLVLRAPAAEMTTSATTTSTSESATAASGLVSRCR